MSGTVTDEVVVQPTSTFKPVEVPSRGYVRKRGTKELFAFSEGLIMRGDMIMYDGDIPVPDSFVIPQQEIAIVEAIKKAKEGKLGDIKRDKVTTYLRKMGTKDIFISTPALLTRGDMVPYEGILPVPEGFIVPPQELDLLAYMKKGEVKPQVPVAPIVEPVIEPDVAEQLADAPIEPIESVEPTPHEKKICVLMELMKEIDPSTFPPKLRKPDARVLTKMMGGKQVRREERDEAWDRYLLLNPIREIQQEE